MMSFRRFATKVVRFVVAQRKKVVINIAELPPSELLKGRTALITGGTSGIGLEIAKAFMKAGATVVITGRNSDKLKEVINLLNHEYQHITHMGYSIQMDMTDIASFDECLKEAIDKVGKIDILVNNAGILGGGISRCTEQEYDTILDTNLKGVFFLSQKLGHYMRDNQIEGNILNIASSSSLRPANSAYTLSKWGIRGLTMGLARTLAPYGIVVNGIAPGPTATPMIMSDPHADNYYLPRSLAGRYAMPCEIANMAVVLVSNMGRMIIGDIVYMTGGAGLINNEDVDYSFD